MNIKQCAAVLAGTLLSLSLVACGGGSGGSAMLPISPSSITPPAAGAAAGPAADPGPSGPARATPVVHCAP
jgi:hypothetical protein